nr:family 78 glycoside hydrolase catalytic domain [uncultured Draconibacterium sp.]
MEKNNIQNRRTKPGISLIAFISLFMIVLSAHSTTSIKKLRVESLNRPLAIEDANPFFSWQMESDVTGQKQLAYQIRVIKEKDGNLVWDSKKTASGLSNNISYEGKALEPEAAYTWKLTVWDADGEVYNEESRFETGLMNPELSAWNGAQFIGTNSLTLDAASAVLFEINTDFQITKGNAVSLILGANDFRFNDSFQNIENVAGENYVRVELDVAGVGTETGAVLNIYRVGYGKDDSPIKPYKVISTALFPETNINEIITSENRNNKHNISISVDASNISIKIDGKVIQTEAPLKDTNQNQFRRRTPSITITNYGSGGNSNSFPNLNSIGFACNPGDEVVFTNYKILNTGQSNPKNNVVFGPKTGATYNIFKSLPGITVEDNSIRVRNSLPKTTIAYADPSFGSLSMLRTNFSTQAGKSVSKARLYVTSMGSNEVYINGKRVGEDWFGPGASQFRETLGYYAYDVTKMVQSGKNTMGAILIPGWYTGYMTFTPGNFNFFGDTEALLAKLVIIYNDGTNETVVTNPGSWKLFKNGPIEYGSFFNGERYNALKESNISVGNDVNGWTTVSFDDSDWTKAEIVQPREWIDFDIVARYDLPVRVVEELEATEVMKTHSKDSHTYTYNMGVNMVGVPSITIPEGWLNKGDVVILRYGEQVYPGFPGDKKEYIDLYGNEGKEVAGRILTETYRAAFATDFYTAKDNKEVVIHPRSTFRGYQYIQITIPGHEGPLPLSNIKGIVLSSDKLPTGTYKAETTDGKTGELANQLFKNIQRSQLGNFFTLPTDCPQRNERMGWTGDAQAYTRTGIYNSDTRNFYRQWMVALRDDQGVGSDTEAPGGIGSTVPTYNTSDATNFSDGTTWAAAVCMVPWQLYIQYGDKKVVEENMETMMLWLNGMDFYDFSEEYPHLSSKTSGLSDWLAMDGHTPAQLVNNAIYIYMMEVTAIMADAIGREDYAALLRDRHKKAKAEWNEVFIEPVSGRTRNMEGQIVHSQTSYATPLSFNTFSDENIEKAQKYLAELSANPSLSNTNPDGSRVEYPENSGRGGFGGSTAKTEDFLPFTITTGFSGTPNILPALSRAGNVTDVYKMFSSTDYTSWLYPVTMGATSIWERWNGYEAAFQENNQNSMNSFNHFALGAVGQWMYEFQLGITTDHATGEAGYKHFVLQPQVGGNFTSLSGSYDSNYGSISSSWEADGKGNLTLFTAVVPANTTATLYLPVSDYMKNLKSVDTITFTGISKRNGITVAQYELISGKFEFTVADNVITIKTL